MMRVLRTTNSKVMPRGSLRRPSFSTVWRFRMVPEVAVNTANTGYFPSEGTGSMDPSTFQYADTEFTFLRLLLTGANQGLLGLAGGAFLPDPSDPEGIHRVIALRWEGIGTGAFRWVSPNYLTEPDMDPRFKDSLDSRVGQPLQITMQLAIARQPFVVGGEEA